MKLVCKISDFHIHKFSTEIYNERKKISFRITTPKPLKNIPNMKFLKPM